MSQPSSGGFPDLRIVSVRDLLLHEDVDLERVARLLDRLSADGILRNPPIVASLPGSDRYLLLDGANRVSALENLDIPHLLVQVEPYDNAELEIRHPHLDMGQTQHAHLRSVPWVAAHVCTFMNRSLRSPS